MNQDGTASSNLEIEVKFYIVAIHKLRHRLAELGTTSRPEVFESNIRFDDADETFKKKGQLLRLRKDGTCRLTYKCRPVRPDPEFKVYQELEVEVDDFEVMNRILQSLGFRPTQVYEKWRQVFDWRDVKFCLDRMPFGTFLEIEGPGQSIKNAARQLGLVWKDRILTNYLAIFEIVRKKFELPFDDVTFSNFERHPVDIIPLLPILRGRDYGAT